MLVTTLSSFSGLMFLNILGTLKRGFNVCVGGLLLVSRLSLIFLGGLVGTRLGAAGALLMVGGLLTFMIVLPLVDGGASPSVRALKKEKYYIKIGWFLLILGAALIIYNNLHSMRGGAFEIEAARSFKNFLKIK